jgi:hypothetical protein
MDALTCSISLDQDHYLGHCKVMFHCPIISSSYAFQVSIHLFSYKLSCFVCLCLMLQDHPKDAELLNKPIQHYEQME